MKPRNAEEAATVLCTDILHIINAADRVERAEIAREAADDYRTMRDTLLEEGAYDSPASSRVAEYAASRVNCWQEALAPLLTSGGSLTASVYQDNPDGAASALLTVTRLFEHVADLEGNGRES